MVASVHRAIVLALPRAVSRPAHSGTPEHHVQGAGTLAKKAQKPAILSFSEFFLRFISEAENFRCPSAPTYVH